MLDSLTRNIIYGKTYCSLEHIGSDIDLTITILNCKKQKGELTVVDKETVSTIESVKEFDSKLKYAHLIINNNQVLQKATENRNNLSDIILINQTFPSIVLDDFYYEILRSKEKAYVYICRKAYINTLIKNYEEHSIFITQWSLGNTPVSSLLPFLKQETSLKTSTDTLALEDGEIVAIYPTEVGSYQNDYYDIEGIKIEGSYINTLGGILTLLAGTDEDRISTNFEEQQEQQQSTFTQNRLFAIGLPLAVGVLFALFLVNFLFYSYYYDEVAVLQEIGSTNILQKKLLVRKDSIVDQKQKRFEDVIASASSSASYFIDEIAKGMPDTILLEGLQYQPIEKRIRNNKAVQVKENTIIITGETAVNSDLSSWISSLETLEFSESVSINNLEKKANNIRFSIEFLIKSGYDH